MILIPDNSVPWKDHLTRWILSKLGQITLPCIVIHQKLGCGRVLSLHDSWLEPSFSSCPNYSSSKHRLYDSALTRLRTRSCITCHVNDCRVVTLICWSLILSKVSKVSTEKWWEVKHFIFSTSEEDCFQIKTSPGNSGEAESVVYFDQLYRCLRHPKTGRNTFLGLFSTFFHFKHLL